MAKVDLRHAYRSVPVHPSWTALGLKWRFSGQKSYSYLVDTRLPFGCRSAPGIFHRIMQTVKRMMIRRGFNLIVVYLDDFLVIGRTKEECQLAFDTLCSLLCDLGFQLILPKLVSPCQSFVLLCVHLDTITLTFSLPSAKLQDQQITVA